jgi:hypothetical protein
MICSSTTETKSVMTVTLNCGDDSELVFRFNVATNSINTIRCRTPFEVVFVVNVGASEKFLISAALSVTP